MSDFIDVTKYLDKIPVRVATYTEALNANIPFDKQYQKIPTRAIKRLFWYIQLQPNLVQTTLPGRLVFQYNITFPQPFYILNVLNPPPFMIPGLATTGMQCIGVVKWRNGTNVQRYCFLNKNNKGPFTYFINHQNKISYNSPVVVPDYGNQVIPQNCVIEFWTSLIDILASGQLSKQVGFGQPLYIQTSLMSDPVTADDLMVIFNGGNALQIADIGVNLPEALPYNQPTIVWNDNP